MHRYSGNGPRNILLSLAFMRCTSGSIHWQYGLCSMAIQTGGAKQVCGTLSGLLWICRIGETEESESENLATERKWGEAAKPGSACEERFDFSGAPSNLTW